MRWDASTYGRSFAPVYDLWYGTRGDESAVLAALEARTDPLGGRSVLELGVGTGRLAIPLAAAGWTVSGVDSSAEMLERLAAKCADEAVEVTATLDDAGTDGGPPWPRAEVVLAAYNFLFNLPGAAAQLTCLQRAAATGAVWLVVEAFVGDPRVESGVSEVVLDNGTEVRTTVDAASASITGVHRGVDGVDRPWRVWMRSPTEIDDLAAAAGWQLDRRDADWDGSPFDPASSSAHVSWYCRG